LQHSRYDNQTNKKAGEQASPASILISGTYPLPIRYILVPQTGQEPLVAGLPFFIWTAFGSFISRWVRHFKQYACIFASFGS
jgi:hypothetical protein